MEANRAPLDVLLDLWAESGGLDTIETRVRAHRALALDGPWSRERLRKTLQAILAHDERERQRFDSILDAAVAQLPLATLGAPAQPAGASGARKPSFQRRQLSGEQAGAAWSELRVLLGAFVAVALTVAAIGALLDTSDPPPVTRPRPLGEPASVVERLERRDLSRKSYRLWLGMGAALALSAGIAGLFWRTRRQKRAEPHAVEGDGLELELPRGEAGQEYRRLGNRREDFSTLALKVPLVDVNRRLLDQRRTVSSTLRNGGFLSPVFRGARQVPSIGIVRFSECDWVAEQLVAELIEALRKGGVQVVETSLPEPGRLNLVLVDVAQAFHANDLPTLKHWASHHDTALVEVRDTALWGAEVDAASFPLFPLSPHGIGEALAALDKRIQPAQAHASFYGDEKSRLREAFLLAAACAIAEPTDLPAADRVRELFTPWLPLSALQRVAALPGVTRDRAGLHFSSRLKQWLLERTSPGFLGKVLTWQLETRLDKASVPPNTLASAELARERALATVTLGSLGLRSADDVRRALAELEAQAGTAAFRRALVSRVDETLRALPDGGVLRRRAPWALKRLRTLAKGGEPKPLDESASSVEVTASGPHVFSWPTHVWRWLVPLVGLAGLVLGSFRPVEATESVEVFATTIVAAVVPSSSASVRPSASAPPSASVGPPPVPSSSASPVASSVAPTEFGRFSFVWKDVREPGFTDGVAAPSEIYLTSRAGEVVVATNGEGVKLRPGTWILSASTEEPIVVEPASIRVKPGDNVRRQLLLSSAHVLLDVNLPSNVAGDVVRIDGESITPEMVGGYRLEAGGHTITVRQPGYELWAATVNVPAGSRRSVTVPPLEMNPPATLYCADEKQVQACAESLTVRGFGEKCFELRRPAKVQAHIDGRLMWYAGKQACSCRAVVGSEACKR